MPLSNSSSKLHSKPSTLQTIKAVAWSFFGVRRRKDFEEDIKHIKPYHVMAVGLIGGFLFVVLLMILVNIIV